MVMDFGRQSSAFEFSEIELSSDFSTYRVVCCDWLIDEGRVRASQHAKYANGTSKLLNPVLSAYGISLLGTNLGPVEDPKSLGDATGEVSKLKDNTQSWETCSAEFSVE